MGIVLGLCLLAAVAVGLVGLAGIVRPLPSLAMTSRSRAGAAVGFSLMSFFVLTRFLPEVTAEDRERAQQTRESIATAKLASNQSAEDSQDVWFVCQQEMKVRLKSPSSAEFGLVDPLTAAKPTAADPSVLRYSNYVDAQNEFGAMIRTTFQCDAKKSGSTWEVVSLIAE